MPVLDSHPFYASDARLFSSAGRVESVVPSLIFQVAMLPSVIVGESAGILKF